MTQSAGKVIGWTTAYNISGVSFLATVQARSRDEAVTLLLMAGFRVVRPDAVYRTITIGHRERHRVTDMRSRNIEREATRV